MKYPLDVFGTVGSSGASTVIGWVPDTGTASMSSASLELSGGLVHESLAGFPSLSSFTVSSSNSPMIRFASVTPYSVNIPDTSASGAVANDGFPAEVVTPVSRSICYMSVTVGTIAGFLCVDIDGPELMTINDRSIIER